MSSRCKHNQTSGALQLSHLITSPITHPSLHFCTVQPPVPTVKNSPMKFMIIACRPKVTTSTPMKMGLLYRPAKKSYSSSMRREQISLKICIMMKALNSTDRGFT